MAAPGVMLARGQGGRGEGWRGNGRAPGGGRSGREGVSSSYPPAEASDSLTLALEIFERLGTLIEPDKVRAELAQLPAA